MSETKPTLGYWAIRGLAQPIRILLHFAGEKFEDKLYVAGPAPDYNRDCWLNEKFTLGLDFPNLPYYIDGDIKITQSNAILRYIARKHNLCGETEAERVRVDVMENTAMDFRNGAVRLFYSGPKDYADRLPAYLKALAEKLQGFDKYLSDKQYFAGDKVTFVDFVMYELLDQHRVLQTSCLDDFANLKAFMTRIEELASVKAFMESDGFMTAPINGPMASFGGSK